MLNRIILIGRLTRDPELRILPSGVPVASFTLAVDRPFTNQQGERETDFIDIVVWRKQAETVSNHLSKGRLVAVEGRLQVRSYETADGQKRKVAEVVADNVRFLDRARENAGGEAPVSVSTRGFDPGVAAAGLADEGPDVVPVGKGLDSDGVEGSAFGQEG